jgi:hypothetical protein
MKTHVSHKKLITKAKVFTLLRDVHRSKLVDITTLDVILSRTYWFMVFLAMIGNTSSSKED